MTAPTNDSRFLYVLYIRTTPQKLWQALRDPEFTKQYWCQTRQNCDWKLGAAWEVLTPDGRIADAGEVMEIEPERKLVLSWRHELRDDIRAEGYSKLTYELEPVGESVKLSVVHEMAIPDSQLIGSVSQGWPHILSSLKSLLETGESLVETREWPEEI